MYILTFNIQYVVSRRCVISIPVCTHNVLYVNPTLLSSKVNFEKEEKIYARSCIFFIVRERPGEAVLLGGEARVWDMYFFYTHFKSSKIT